ncbi:two-component system phosphate regulon sensor histidine kinase PhoR [Jejuia pallidilutea]|uniref:histidine kinase n=1 Tax=Jejuia pallidilutea TaxID=504487 RepID=A0A362X3G1_9FLAO|nr:HAMP domain-containing sensor histidine kinase [Jejuia pallidilutea]PQV50487.1 two-component system phosphate regulon sensor histidine kinase PhoR [Jejuia pallidilutea]
MSKKVFVLSIVLMSLSLIGIIFVQAYFINDAYQNEKARFKFNVKSALSYVSNAIEQKELDRYFERFQELDSEKKKDSAEVSRLFIYQRNNSTKDMLIYKSDVLEENYKLSSSLFDIGLDSIDIKRIIGNSEMQVVDGSDFSDEDIGESPILKIVNSGVLKDAERNSFNKNFKAFAKTIPVHKRVSREEVADLLSTKFKQNGIDIDFEFAIYSRDLATKVYSEGFEKTQESTFSIPVFYDENNQSNYKLLVNFPKDGKFIFSTILGMVLLSIVFTSIIIIAYSSALFQLIRQRKISQIKTDFINNMTHEFKTPIATINLALDAIKNPKIINDNEKVLRYLRMIREENKRMHAQVENVLRISKLEKNELNISKDRVDLNDLVEDAVTHVELIVEDRKGYIKTHLNAQQTSVLANDTHFTNVIVNILDNAIKYSPESPKIDVFTENAGTNVILKIQDQGSGMSKAAAKRVFEKFYREHTGDIHNVKGHGLGLAYVKRIVDDHQGFVSVESEKGKGSIFTIKLPLIS